ASEHHIEEPDLVIHDHVHELLREHPRRMTSPRCASTSAAASASPRIHLGTKVSLPSLADSSVIAETCIRAPHGPILLRVVSITVDEDTLDDARDAWRAGETEGVLAADINGTSLGSALEAACWGAGNDP